MAGKFVSVVLIGLQGVDPTTKLVAVCLADCANEKHGGLAWPSVATIARRAGICNRQVQAHLRTLEAAGWITRESAGHGGRGMTTRYRLRLDAMTAPASEPKPCSPPQGNPDLNPAVQRTKPCSPPHKPCGPAHVNPAAHRTRIGIEPELLQPGLNPAHAHASGNPNTGQNPFKKFSQINPGIPNPQPKPNGKAIPGRNPASRKPLTPAQATTRREETDAEYSARMELESRRQTAMALAALQTRGGTTQ